MGFNNEDNHDRLINVNLKEQNKKKKHIQKLKFECAFFIYSIYV